MFMLVFDIGKHSLQDFSTHVTGNGAVPRITLTLCNYSTFLKKYRRAGITAIVLLAFLGNTFLAQLLTLKSIIYGIHR